MDEIRRIRAALAAGITKTEMAERAGVARRSLDSIDSDDWNPTMSTIMSLVKAADDLAAERMAALRGVA